MFLKTLRTLLIPVLWLGLFAVPVAATAQENPCADLLRAAVFAEDDLRDLRSALVRNCGWLCSEQNDYIAARCSTYHQWRVSLCVDTCAASKDGAELCARLCAQRQVKKEYLCDQFAGGETSDSCGVPDPVCTQVRDAYAEGIISFQRKVLAWHDCVKRN